MAHTDKTLSPGAYFRMHGEAWQDDIREWVYLPPTLREISRTRHLFTKIYWHRQRFLARRALRLGETPDPPRPRHDTGWDLW